MAATVTSADDAPVVEVRRSRKRRRTVAAYREDDKVVVLVPARFTRAEEREWVATMVARLEKSEKRRRPSEPPYPETLKAQGIETDVAVMVTVSAEGKVVRGPRPG